MPKNPWTYTNDGAYDSACRWTVRDGNGKIHGAAAEEDSARKMARRGERGKDLIAVRKAAPVIPVTAPDPITVEWLRDLLERHHITQREAARLLRVDERTARKWATGERQMPWAAGELLRRLVTLP